MNKAYTVSPAAPGLYVIMDMSTGAQLNRVNIPGVLVSGPIVSGDTCSITTKSNNVNTTYIVRLPSGAIVNRFCN